MTSYRHPITLLTAALAVLVLAGAACSSSDDDNAGGGETDLTGTVVVSGSSTVEPISSLNGEAFNADNPDVAVKVDGPGTGDGFELFCNGETDISDASRQIEEEEAAACEDKGIEYVELEVGIDGLTVMTSPDDTEITCLSFGDLYALLGPESQGFENWTDANDLAAEVGGDHAPYPDMPLSISGPGEESGTYDSFIELALGDLIETRAQEEVTRPDYNSSPNDNVIIEGVQGATGSLGWVGYAFYVNNQDTVKAIEVDGGEGCVAPTEETIQDGSYPLSRSLYVYVNTAKAAESDAVKAFMDFYMSDGGRVAVTEAGYVDIPDERWEKSVQAWEQAVA